MGTKIISSLDLPDSSHHRLICHLPRLCTIRVQECLHPGPVEEEAEEEEVEAMEEEGEVEEDLEGQGLRDRRLHQGGMDSAIGLDRCLPVPLMCRGLAGE